MRRNSAKLKLRPWRSPFRNQAWRWPQKPVGVEPTITRFGTEIMRSLACLVMMSLIAASLQSAQARDGENWVVSWTGSVQGPYPVGNPSAQPDQKFAFPEPATG